MKKSLLIITWSITMLHELHAQSKHGIENYNIIGAGSENVWVPVIHYTGSSRFYAEARYNYEELKTGSVYAGKSFKGGRQVSYSITPMAGLVFGKFNGVSAAANMSADYREFNFSSQVQYTMSYRLKEENFFYNWSELSYGFMKNLFAGVSIQQTCLYREQMNTAAGVLFGYSSGKITIPVYLFNPVKKDRHFMAGFIVEWD